MDRKGTLPLDSLEDIFSALPSSLVILSPNNPDYTVEEVNNAFQKLSGIDRRDIIGKPFIKIFSEHISDDQTDQIDEIRKAIKTAITLKSGSETGIFEINLIGKSSPAKGNLCVQFKCSPLLNDDESLAMLILEIEDMTELLTQQEKQTSGAQQIKSKEELVIQAANSKSQYESASQELDDFVYSVSHDLRAPLRRIDGFSQELINEYAGQLDETGVHYLNRIRQGAQDMGHLIDDLLKLSRISRKEAERKEVDLGRISKMVFDELVDLEPNRNAVLNLGSDLTLKADPGLLKAMMMNLISNALKFTSGCEEARIIIDQKNIEGEKVFYISDNGIGFDPAYSDKLFKAFSRLHSSRDFKGTGIGLATVKRIVGLHGGEIWAESEIEEGATFYFKL